MRSTMVLFFSASRVLIVSYEQKQNKWCNKMCV